MLILRRVPRTGMRLSAGLTAVETTVALAIAHTAAGGVLPSAGWLLTIGATAYGAGVLVLSGRVPVRVMLPVLVGLQVLLHAWLVALTEGAGAHSHGSAAEAVLGLTGPMLLAHVAAGLVAAVAWALRRRAVDVLLGWADTTAPAIRHRSRVAAGRSRPTPAGRSVSALPTRGPPRALPAAA
ncbi:hypothetical protein SFC88_18835 [Nocardioides sp. HM23]|uniref:hypothetical protein n=1 Tax=Nocardioides bizhenqiangii TaxID=3095076 RepID=UPI002ACAD418|nr:hypothetical protein [Nocardioides sp. HM23]MDZ5622903.1 hypothetical protein [Nocardioides sp. HM23]